jgi:pimeloyl-ACP methyl ester carboxylesterase
MQPELTQPITKTPETIVRANGIDICYDTFGDPTDPPMLLIHGLGMQMTGWDEALCSMLAERGFWVIRFDNRDVGKSTHFDDLRMPTTTQMIGKQLFNRDYTPPYALDEMAADAVGLLNVLDIDKAHVIGASMGGMIAQLVAIHYPERVLSLTSWMSTSNERDLPQPSPNIILKLLKPAPQDRAGSIEDSVYWAHLLYGSRYQVDEETTRKQSGERYDRAFYPIGVGRQLAAIGVAWGRREALKKVTVPALVIHGDEDPLVPMGQGLDVEFALPNSRLLILPGVGHVMPPETWAETVDAIVANTRRANG